MIRLAGYLLMFLLVLTLAIVGCSRPDTASTPAGETSFSNSANPQQTSAIPTPSQTSSPSPVAAQTIKLRWAHGIPPQDAYHQKVFIPWTQMIKERTTAIGKPVEITIFPAESLVKMRDTYDAIISGVADMGSNYGPGHFKGRMPIAEGLELPLLFPNCSSACLTSQELFNTRPEFQKELAGTKVLAFMPPSPYKLLSRTKPIQTLSDLNGMKTHARGGTDVDIIKALGAVPVSIPQAEVYSSLERGVVDSAMLGWQGAFSFKWYEVTKYRTELPIPLYATSLMISMNLNTWNNLPAEVQGIFNEFTGVYLSRLCGETQDTEEPRFAAMIKEYDKKVGNPEFYTMPQDEFQKWKDCVAPVYEKWISDVTAKGIPGKSIFEDIQRLAVKYSPAK